MCKLKLDKVRGMGRVPKFVSHVGAVPNLQDGL